VSITPSPRCHSSPRAAQHRSHPAEQAQLSLPDPVDRDAASQEGKPQQDLSCDSPAAGGLCSRMLSLFLQAISSTGRRSILCSSCLHRDVPRAEEGQPIPRGTAHPSHHQTPQSTFSGCRWVSSTGAQHRTQAAHADPIPAPSLLQSCQIRSCNTHTRVLQEQLLIQHWTHM